MEVQWPEKWPEMFKIESSCMYPFQMALQATFWGHFRAKNIIELPPCTPNLRTSQVSHKACRLEVDRAGEYLDILINVIELRDSPSSSDYLIER